MYPRTFRYSANYQALAYKGMLFFNLPEGINSMHELEQMGGMGDTAA
ncbi:hypothetical protein [Candidatus Merdisoma sp. JLR.KK006]|jgi:hypothetical protein